MALKISVSEALTLADLRVQSKNQGETAKVIIRRSLLWFEEVSADSSPIDELSSLIMTHPKSFKQSSDRDSDGVVWRLNSLVLDLLAILPSNAIIQTISETTAEILSHESAKVSDILDKLKDVLNLRARNALIPLLDTTTDNMKRICKTSPASLGWRLAQLWIHVLACQAQTKRIQ